MFNIGAGEIILILIVAFVVVGPQDLPKVARSLARGIKSLQTLFNDFKEETGLDEALTEFKEVEKDLEKTISEVDPTKEIREATKDLNKQIKDVEKIVKPKPKKK